MASPTVGDLGRFRRDYATAPGAEPLIEEVRRKEVDVAFDQASAQDAAEGYRAFRTAYHDWSEAAAELEKAYRREAILALQDAVAATGALGIEPLVDYRATYPEAEWVERANDAIAAYVLRPLRTALDDRTPLGPEAADTLIAQVQDHPIVRTWAPYDDHVLILADSAKSTAMYRVYRALYPDSARTDYVMDAMEGLLWAEAEALDDVAGASAAAAQAWLRYLHEFPGRPRALDAEQRYIWHRELAEADSRGHSALVMRRREVERGQVELTLEVWDCHGRRVLGLDRDAFAVYEGAEQRDVTDFWGLEEERPIDIVFALDMSGSMEVERDAVRLALEHCAATFDFRAREAKLGLVTFSEELLDEERPRSGTRKFTHWMENLRSTTGGAGEDGVAALVSSARMLSSSDSERVVILMSDEPLQANLTGRANLDVKSDPCTDLQKVSHCLQGCGTSRDLSCRNRCLRKLGGDHRRWLDSCRERQTKLRRSSAPTTSGFSSRPTDHAAQQALEYCLGAFDWNRLGREMQGCATPILPGSGLHDKLVSHLDERAIRPFVLIGTDESGTHGFRSLAEQLDGGFLAVPDNATVPDPYIEQLEAVAEQLSAQYILRFRTRTPGVQTHPLKVVVRPGYRWRDIGSLPPGQIIALEQIGGSRDCPEFVASTRQGGLYRSRSCGQGWHENSAPSGLSFGAAATFEGRLALLSDDGRVWRFGEIGLVELDASPPEAHQISYDAHGRLWALGHDGVGTPHVVGWDTAGEVGWEWSVPASPVDATRAPVLVAVPGKLRDTVCVTIDGERRHCRAVENGAWAEEPLAGLPAESTPPIDLVQVGIHRDVLLLTPPSGAVYRSIDGGGSWLEVLDDTAGPRRLEVLHGPRDVTCAASSSSVLCSEDEGRTWFPTGLEFVESGDAVLTAVDDSLTLGQGGALRQVHRIVNRELPSANVFFETASSEPQTRMGRFLEEIAEVMRSEPNLRLRIEGHADYRGTDEYNEELARQRAEKVSSILMQMGFPEDRFDVLSFGERRPVRKGNSSSDLARNRRVELILLRHMPAPGWYASDCP